MSIIKTLGMNLQGRYKIAVVNGITNEEIWRQPEWEKNLILNQGMNALANATYGFTNTVAKYGVCGTGTRSNGISAGESTGSSINGTLQLFPVGTGIQDFNSTTYGGWVGGVLESGDMIKFDDATEVRVTGVSATSATVTPTTMVNSQSFTIWKTSQTGLQTEVKRGGDGILSSAYLTGVGNCGTTVVGNVVSQLRTIDFATESILKSYTEVGVAWDTDNSPINSTFSRILLPAPVSIDIDQRLRLIYQLNIELSPTTPVCTKNATISGWPVAPSTNTNMSESIQSISTTYMQGMSQINTSGTAVDLFYHPFEIPSVGSYCAFFASPNSQSLVSLGSTPRDRSTNAEYCSSTADAYIADSYTLYKNGTFSLSQVNRTNIASIGFGSENSPQAHPYNTMGQAYACVFEQTQSKFNTQTLSFTFRWVWGRTLA